MPEAPIRDNVMVMDTATLGTVRSLRVRSIALYSIGECTAVLTDNTNTILTMRANSELSMVDFGEDGHVFTRGIELSSITTGKGGANVGTVYVYLV